MKPAQNRERPYHASSKTTGSRIVLLGRTGCLADPAVGAQRRRPGRATGAGRNCPAAPETTEAWKQAIADTGFQVVTVFAAYEGEDYADIPTVERTVGFIPESTRHERELRTRAVIDFAAALGVKSFGCHVGCVPEDKQHPDYAPVRDLVRRICDSPPPMA